MENESLICVSYLYLCAFFFLFFFFHLISNIWFWNRYLLRRSALEVFMVDRSNFFFDFAVPLHLLFLVFYFSCWRHFNNLWTLKPSSDVLLSFLAFFWLIFCLRVWKGEEMHTELLYKLVLLIWTIYIWQLRFLPYPPCFNCVY